MQHPPSRLLLGAAWLGLGLGSPRAASPQAERPDEWGSPQTVAFIERAIERRVTWGGDTSLRNYRAQAESHLYFLFDTGRDTERQLVKADQLALNIMWRKPGETRQVFIGRREKKNLPTNISYHLDHLTVVMDNYPDSISLGEGAEVNGVVHPLAPTATANYEYRLADTLTLALQEREITVYRIEVRPLVLDAPGVVGALFLDGESADIVRMDFTFTKASYLDEQLDYITVRVENALWEGSHWLPHSQGLELRREFDVLSFPAGGIIRSEVSVGDYEFDDSIPDPAFRGPSVVTLPRERLADYEFETSFYDALDPSVATEPPTLEEVREEAARVVSRSVLQRSESFKLAIPGVSSVIRFRRAEGLYLGPGFARSIPGRVDAVLTAGYAIGAERGEVDARFWFPVAGRLRAGVEGYWNRPDDVFPWSASSGIVSTLAMPIDGEDFREPFWASGGRLKLERRWAGLTGEVALAWEEWRSAELSAAGLIDRSYRAVRPNDAGTAVLGSVQLRRPALGALESIGGWSWAGGLEGASKSIAGDFEYVRLIGRAEAFWPELVGEANLRLSGAAGGTSGGAIPSERLFVAGGRGTVRGYQFNRFGGNIFGAAGTEVSRSIIYPWVTLAVFGDIGWVGLEGESAREASAVWRDAGTPVDEARGPLVGLGAGVGFVFDIVRLEVARGLTQRGIWEAIFRVSPRFWGWL